jgi:hypothetical protein
MAFNKDNFTLLMGTCGAIGINIWAYATTDNLYHDLGVSGTTNATYFQNGATYFKPRFRDMIFISHNSSTAPFGVAIVTEDWDVNGGTVVLSAAPV